MDKMDNLFAALIVGTLILFAALIFGTFIFSAINAKQKDRELTIRERELELKAEQYPYKNETKLEIVHD